VRRTHKYVVAKQRPNARQRVAHRRLTEPYSGCRAADVPLGQERIERNEEIEINRAQVHGLNDIQRMNIDSTLIDWINGPGCDLLLKAPAFGVRDRNTEVERWVRRRKRSSKP
jgi:hypothetical protein